RIAGEIDDTLILTEHPHTYTIGKAGGEENLIADEKRLSDTGIAVHRIDRGGDITYHGPGQIVGYPILDMHDYYLDVHRFLRDLEEVLIQTLAFYDLKAERVSGLTGVWVSGAKVAAIGIKVSRWVTKHGFAFNVNTDLAYFGNIVPCGITDKPVTSIQQLVGERVSLARARDMVAREFSKVFDIDLVDTSLEELFASAVVV
ncbi:lipoyl(octanoyl) transferase LipB, partial [bacterium]|nr:lipoyl(octanoyl) transferase LipB [bacterium]